jgi:peroxiredoxin
VSWKSVYLALCPALQLVLAIGCGVVAWQWRLPVLLMPALGLLLFPLRLYGYYLTREARTDSDMPELMMPAALCAALTASSVLQLSRAGLPIGVVLVVLAVVMVINPLLYVYWYSAVDRSASKLKVGSVMPAVSFVDVDGKDVASATLTHQRALWLFYRGNWCPLCMAQIREVAEQYQHLHDAGVAVIMVSPQPSTSTAALSKKFAAPMTFLVDKDAAAARALGIVHEAGLPTGFQVLGFDSDTVLPTALLTDEHGVVRALHETDNYRVRPEPETFLRWVAALDPA